MQYVAVYLDVAWLNQSLRIALVATLAFLDADVVLAAHVLPSTSRRLVLFNRLTCNSCQVAPQLARSKVSLHQVLLGRQ